MSSVVFLVMSICLIALAIACIWVHQDYKQASAGADYYRSRYDKLREENHDMFKDMNIALERQRHYEEENTKLRSELRLIKQEYAVTRRQHENLVERVNSLSLDVADAKCDGEESA